MGQVSYKLLAKTLRALGGRTERQRSYASAKTTRLTNDWTSINASANQEIKQSLRVLRARSRQLARDDDYMKGWLDKLVTNVIGRKGIMLQANATDAQGVKLTKLNKAVEVAWLKWSKKGNASANGKLSWRDIQALALVTMAVDGECIIREIYDRNNPFAYTLQFIDVDWLDEDYNDPKLPNGNRVVMSIELDQYDKPVNFYFTPPRWYNIAVPDFPGNVLGRAGSDRIQVPAREIIHLFMHDRPGQARGVPWARTAMRRLNMLDGYEEAELVGARVAASQMAFAVPPQPDAGLAGDTLQDQDIEQEVQAGMISTLPAGYTLEQVDFKRPGTTYGAFVKSLLQPIAVALNISYNTLTSDLESTSYSSGRIGSVAERDHWREVQDWLAEHLCQDVYSRWLLLNVGTEAIQGVPESAIEQVDIPIWRGRGFDWVDPSKDAKADITLVEAGLKTMTEVYAERGRDFEEAMEEIAHEQEIKDHHSLAFGADKEALNALDQVAMQGDIADAAAKQKKAAA
jgi:lambda family phage portal protein